jgi:hypothetical protein
MTTTTNDKQYNKLKSFWVASDGFMSLRNCPEGLLIRLASSYGLRVVEIAPSRYEITELHCDIPESFKARIERV